MRRVRRISLIVLLLINAIFPAFIAHGQTTASDDVCDEAAPEFERIARLGRGQIHDLEVSPDGSLLAIASSRGVWLYDAGTLDLVGELLLPEETAAVSVSWSPENRALAAGYADGVRVWNTVHAEVTWWYDRVADVSHVAWSPDGSMIAFINDGFVEESMFTIVHSDLRVMYPFSDDVIWRQADLISNRDQALWSGDGQQVLYLSQVSGFPRGDTDADIVPLDVQPSIWSLEEGFFNSTRSFVPDSSAPLPVHSAAWSPDGTQIALSLYDLGADTGEVQIRSSDTGEVIASLPLGVEPAWSRDGSRFAVYVPSLETGFIIRDAAFANEVYIPTTSAEHYALSADGSRLYAYHGGLLVTYDTSTGAVTHELDLHPQQVLEAVWSADGNWLATRYTSPTLDGSTVYLWNAAGELHHRLVIDSLASRMFWSPDSTRLALLTRNSVEIRDPLGTFSLSLPAQAPVFAAWSPINAQLAAIQRGGEVFVWDAQTGALAESAPTVDADLSWSARGSNNTLRWDSTRGLRSVIENADGSESVYAIVGGSQVTQRADLPEDEAFVVPPLQITPEQVSLSQGNLCLTYAYRDYSQTGRLQQLLAIDLWADRSALARVPLPRPVRNTFLTGIAAWSADGRLLAVILDDGTLLVWGGPLAN